MNIFVMSILCIPYNRLKGQRLEAENFELAEYEGAFIWYSLNSILYGKYVQLKRIWMIGWINWWRICFHRIFKKFVNIEMFRRRQNVTQNSICEWFIHDQSRTISERNIRMENEWTHSAVWRRRSLLSAGTVAWNDSRNTIRSRVSDKIRRWNQSTQF